MLVAGSALSLAACVGEITGLPGGPEDCPAENAAPDAPSITSPEAGRRDIIGESLTITTSAFADPEGDPHLASQLEIWQLADGAPVQRIWSATLGSADSLTAATLADGSFEVGAALAQDKSYQLTARYRAGEGCSSWSAWSAPRPFGTDDGSSYLFAETEVRDLYLDFTPEVSAALNAQAQATTGCQPYDRESFPATLTFDGEIFEGIGLKTKGGCGSSRDLGGKPSWKLNLEWDDESIAGCPDERRLHGLKHLTLNNEVQDPSFVHEQLAYGLYRQMGVAVPRTNNLRVHVNGELWGLYLNLETVDRTMLGRNFDSNDGMLYEGTYYCDLVSGNLPVADDHQIDTSQCIGREFTTDACSTPDPGADPTDYSVIRGLTQAIEAMAGGAYYPAIDEQFDFDTFLSLWAVDHVINHWDGFVYDIMNNYRLYHDPGVDRWFVIPSGTDQTFGLGRDRSAFSPNNIVARKCLEEDDCKAAFVARVRQVLDVMDAADLPARAIAIRDRLAADVMADPRKEFGYDSFVGAVDQTIQFIQNRRATVEADLAANGF